MNKIGIIYFSGTGNTKFVAQTIKEELEKYNKDSDLISIEQDNVNLNKYESLIIGGPVYVERYPEILLKYMNDNLKEYKGKCMLFSTQANPGGTSTFQNCISKFPHLNVSYCMFVPMPNNFYNFFAKKISKGVPHDFTQHAFDSSYRIDNLVREDFTFQGHVDELGSFCHRCFIGYQNIYRVALR